MLPERVIRVCMIPLMLTRIFYGEVRRNIIGRIPINMVGLLPLLKQSSEMIFQDNPMKVHIPGFAIRSLFSGRMNWIGLTIQIAP